MSATLRRFERDGHVYELHMIQDDPVWHLHEDFGDALDQLLTITSDEDPRGKARLDDGTRQQPVRANTQA